MAQEQNPNSQDSDFFQKQIRENRKKAGRALEEGAEPTQKVTAEPSGAKRGGYFKKRDYES